MALYGYARMSTADQDFTLQERALRTAGCEVIRAEKATATRRDDRRAERCCCDFCGKGIRSCDAS